MGIKETSPQSFRNFLNGQLFSQVQPGQVFLLEGDSDNPNTVCETYSQLLIDYPLDIACIEIGENGHLAFNDPPVADFADAKIVKIVELDDHCRQQQVNDGCFPKLSEVPLQALTLTIPTILSARYYLLYGSRPYQGRSYPENSFRNGKSKMPGQYPTTALTGNSFSRSRFSSFDLIIYFVCDK